MKKTLRRVICALLSACLLTAAAVAASGYDRPGQKLLALTFDDGPGPYSDSILDTLARHGAKATFFMNGNKVAYYVPQVRRMKEEGHQVANHTWDHPQMTAINDAEIHRQVESTAEILTNVTGLTDFYLRPPYGDVNQRIAAAVGVPVITWNVDTLDWKYQSAQRLVSYTGSAAKDGCIILMHETQKSTAQGLDALLDALDSRGFECVTVEELLWRRGIEAQPGTVYTHAVNTGVELCPRALWYDETKLETHWAYGAIQAALDGGFMTRNEYGEFMPNFPISRGDFVSAVARLYGASAEAPAEAPFADVPADSPVAPWALWAKEAGVMSGADGRFEPDKALTRQELAAVLARCARLSGADAAECELPDYADAAEIASWAADSVALCASLGLLGGDWDGKFLPKDDTTRAMGAVVLQRLAALPVPAAEHPAEELPAAETPAAETPAAETPAAETPEA